MSDTKPKIPVIVLAFANERTEDGFLRQLTVEMKAILSALEPAIQKNRCHLKIIPAATQQEIADVFQDEWYEGRIWIFHYGGHADHDELWLENDDGGNQSFFSMGLARFLGAQKGLKLVFLNGCATEDHANLLLIQNIPAVIATSRKINDLMATRFADIFYSGLASGGNIEESFREAEGMLLGTHGPSQFQKAQNSRSLFWVEDEKESNLDLPWRLFLKEEASWFPAQWRLFHQLQEPEEQETIEAEKFVGRTINNYKIEKLLGQGSLGAVFKAVHINLNEERAIKITHKVLEGYEYLKDIVYAGNKGLSSIKHPNVIDFYDVGEIELLGQKRLYMVMELVKGQRLDKIPKSVIAENENKLIDFAVQVVAGLEAAHKTKFTDAAGMPREGIIHGNIKTRKILFTQDGKPKIIDFLFTDLSRSSRIKLEVPEIVQQEQRGENLQNYFPPEVLRGEQKVSKQSDIFGIGAVFFEVFTGKSIADFHFNSIDSLHRFVRKHQLNIPKNISKAVFKATRPAPDERYETAGEMIADMLESTSFWKRIFYRFKRK